MKVSLANDGVCRAIANNTLWKNYHWKYLEKEVYVDYRIGTCDLNKIKENIEK